jgi:hypothetical protein
MKLITGISLGLLTVRWLRKPVGALVGNVIFSANAKGASDGVQEDPPFCAILCIFASMVLHFDADNHDEKWTREVLSSDVGHGEE